MKNGCVPASERAIGRADRLTDRHLRDAGDEFRERRLTLGVSQEYVAHACRISRNHYGLIESGRANSATVTEINRIAVVLGLVASLRLYPSGPPVRDAGHARRLQAFLAHVRPPLTFRLEVALPRTEAQTEWRAWDAMLFGAGARTALELEMRLRDVQALRRRIDLKRRDDPTESFLLLVADTRTNRLVLAEFAELFADLPRLRPTTVHSLLAAGSHPPTGLVLIQEPRRSARGE